MSYNQKGMRAFGEQPGQRDDYWDANIKKLELPPKRKPVLVRPVGGVLTVGVHYIKFQSHKKGREAGFFTLCPNWNLVEGIDEDNDCPVCRDFHKRLRIKSDDYKYLRMPQKYRHLFHAFHVTNIKDGVRDQDMLFGVIEAHTLSMQSIDKAVLMKGGAKPDDPKNGYCLKWLVTDNTKGSEYGDKEITFESGEKLLVKNKEPGVWLVKVGNRVVKGVEQQFTDIIPSALPARELQEKLISLDLYKDLEKATGASVSVGYTGGMAREDELPPVDDESDWNEAEDGGSDDAGDDWEESDGSEKGDWEESGDENTDDSDFDGEGDGEEWDDAGEEEESDWEDSDGEDGEEFGDAEEDREESDGEGEGNSEEWDESGGEGDDWEDSDGEEGDGEEWEESDDDPDASDWDEPEPKKKPAAKKATSKKTTKKTAPKKTAKKKAAPKKTAKKKAAPKKTKQPEPEGGDWDDWEDA